MWCYRRMQKISWSNWITDEEVLEKRSLWNTIKKRPNKRIGHILRHGVSLGIIMEGMADRKKHRGRLRLQYTSQIIEDQQLNWMASDTEVWKLFQINQ